MSDYLDHLVEKSLNETVAVRPRLASRFEPQGMGMGELALASPVGPTPAAEQQALEQRGEAESAPLLLGQPDPGQSGEAWFGARPTEPAAPPPAGTGREALPTKGSIYPNTTGGERSVPKPQRDAWGFESAAPAPGAPVALPQGRALAGDVPTPTAVELGGGRPRAPVLRPAIRRHDPGRASPSETPSPAQPAQPNSPGDRCANQRQSGVVPLAPATTQGEPGSEAAPAPAPTIRVTIGRLELRSSAPPQPRRSRTAPARRGPALSLDAYLKQRNGR